MTDALIACEECDRALVKDFNLNHVFKQDEKNQIPTSEGIKKPMIDYEFLDFAKREASQTHRDCR